MSSKNCYELRNHFNSSSLLGIALSIACTKLLVNTSASPTFPTGTQNQKKKQSQWEFPRMSSSSPPTAKASTNSPNKAIVSRHLQGDSLNSRKAMKCLSNDTMNFFFQDFILPLRWNPQSTGGKLMIYVQMILHYVIDRLFDVCFAYPSIYLPTL